MKRIYKAIDILYPGRCPGCDRILSRDDDMICAGCAGVFRYIGQPACFKCGKKLHIQNAVLCSDCKKKQFSYERGFALWEYNERLRNSIAFFKYHGRAEYGKVYAAMMKQRFSRIIRELKIEAFIPVPIHDERRKMRGYNQAEILADELGRIMGIKVMKDHVVRIKNTAPMKELSDKERVQNLKGAFAINGADYSDTHIPETVMIIDDIYTTGSTVDSIAKVLKHEGVKRVYFVVLAAGRGF